MEKIMKNKPEASNNDAHVSATAEIVASYLLNHKTDLEDLEGVIQRVYGTLVRLSGHAGDFAASNSHAGVTVDDSITPDYIICLEDGKKLKMLKRYLKTNYNMTPEEYRKRWGLPATYPMVAPNYAKKRSQLAKSIGLGKKRINERKSAAVAKGRAQIKGRVA